MSYEQRRQAANTRHDAMTEARTSEGRAASGYEQNVKDAAAKVNAAKEALDAAKKAQYVAHLNVMEAKGNLCKAEDELEKLHRKFVKNVKPDPADTPTAPAKPRPDLTHGGFGPAVGSGHTS